MSSNWVGASSRIICCFIFQTPDECLDARFEQLQWCYDDAGMRELWRTEWMHNRVRMIVASMLSKNLRYHWRAGARWFWNTLVDADLANNTLGWQWTAGCGADAAPYHRIFNPTLQAETFDTERSYIRRWAPELRSLPDQWIHQPWRAPRNVLNAAKVYLGSNYPLPLVDLKKSRDAALSSYRRLRQSHR